jgi:hypothetical protein
MKNNKIKIIKKLDNYKIYILGVGKKENINTIKSIRKDLFNYSFCGNNLYNTKLINLYFESLKGL